MQFIWLKQDHEATYVEEVASFAFFVWDKTPSSFFGATFVLPFTSAQADLTCFCPTKERSAQTHQKPFPDWPGC